MAQPSDFDPLAAWQDMIGRWERQVNEMSAKLSSSEEFSGPMNQASKLLLAARQSSEGAMERFVQSLQLATASQMQAVVERLDRIEQKLDQISAVMQAPAPADTRPTPAPKRTRKPPGESA